MGFAVKKREWRLLVFEDGPKNTAGVKLEREEGRKSGAREKGGREKARSRDRWGSLVMQRQANDSLVAT